MPLPDVRPVWPDIRWQAELCFGGPKPTLRLQLESSEQLRRRNTRFHLIGIPLQSWTHVYVVDQYHTKPSALLGYAGEGEDSAAIAEQPVGRFLNNIR